MDNLILLGCLASFFVILVFAVILQGDLIKKDLLIISIFLVFIFSILLGNEAGKINNTGKFLYGESLLACTVYETIARMPIGGGIVWGALVSKEGEHTSVRRKLGKEYYGDWEFPGSRVYFFSENPPDKFVMLPDGRMVECPDYGHLISDYCGKIK